MLPVTESKFVGIITYTNMNQFYTFSITKLLLVLFLSFGMGAAGFSQCPTSTTILTTQQDIIDFAANYGSCANIPHSITIQESSPNSISDLSPLSFITSISGDLKIHGNQALTTLTGIHNVSTTAGDFRISNNAALVNPGALAISSVDEIIIHGNPMLSSLPNTNINSVTTIYITNNPLLVSRNGFSISDASVQQLFINNCALSDLVLFNQTTNIWQLGIRDMPNLTTLDLGGTLNLGFFSGSYRSTLFTIQDCNNLTNISSSLTGFGSIIIQDNPQLASINNINLSRIDDFQIVNNDALISFALSGTSTSVERTLRISDNDNLVSFNMNSITTSLTSAIISGNPLLANLSGLQNLVTANRLYIGNNDALTDMSGLSSLTSVFNPFTITLNDGLTSCNGLNSLQDVYQLYIQDNINLNTLGNFPALDDISDEIFIEDNAALQDLGSFPAISRIRYRLDINRCPSLTNVGSWNSMSYLNSVNLDIRIVDCPLLNSISGFSGFEAYHAFITDCPALSDLTGLPNRNNYFTRLILDNTGITDLSNISGVALLALIDNQNLTNLDNISMAAGQTTADFYIRDNPNLTSISGLAGFTSFKDFTLFGSPNLASLAGLENVTSVNDISIGGSTQLTSLEQLQNINSIGQSGSPGSLTIYSNPQLNSIDDFCGLHGIIQDARSNTNIYIQNNTYNPTPAEITTQGPCSSIPLPVELLKFSGNALDQGNALSWQTASEENASLFRVQTSSDGQNWKELTQVTAEGESQTLQSYSYLDKLAPSGLSYYRLHLEDLDGSYEYSDVISITRIGADQEQFAFPNPTSGLITLSGLTSSASVRILGPLGKTVLEQQLQDGQVDLSSLPAGIYTLQSEGKSFKVIRN
jgi:hypothetical protein